MRPEIQKAPVLVLPLQEAFTEVQGGTMKIEVEGDLFRVILRWKLKDGSEEPEETIRKDLARKS